MCFLWYQHRTCHRRIIDAGEAHHWKLWNFCEKADHACFPPRPYEDGALRSGIDRTRMMQHPREDNLIVEEPVKIDGKWRVRTHLLCHDPVCLSPGEGQYGPTEAVAQNQVQSKTPVRQDSMVTEREGENEESTAVSSAEANLPPMGHRIPTPPRYRRDKN